MENIHNFLNAVKELGVKPVNLFQTAELYEGTNMKKVIFKYSSVINIIIVIIIIIIIIIVVIA